MQNIQAITIPQPCHEQWHDMTKNNTGRYCSSCSKTVIDFTAMTDQQIIDHLSSAQTVCGRISTQQFASVNHQLYHDNLPTASLWRRMLVAVTMLATMQYAKAQSAPDKPAIEQMQAGFTLGKVISPANSTYKIIIGKIVDGQGEPLPGVTVKAGDFTGITDVEGKFKIQITANIKKITVTYIGFETQEVMIDKKAGKDYKIILKESAMILGGMGAIKKQSLIRDIYQERIVKPFRILLG